MQILHFGRYAYHPDLVAPSALQAPISPFTPHALTATRGRADRSRTSSRCAALAQQAGYDGVEIMGSEGYLINEFIARAHQPAHRPLGRRLREPHALPGRDRARACASASARTSSSSTGSRCSTWSPGGSTLDEVVAARPGDRGGRRHHHQHRHRLARGAHPDHRHLGAARRLHLGHAEGCMGEVGIPLVTTNRINTPEVAEELLADGLRRHGVDGAAAARRPRLRRQGARRAAPTTINTCIGCNQACLDHTFSGQDHLLPGQPARLPRDRAASSRRPGCASASPSSAPGPAGLACAVTAAERGHDGDPVRRRRPRSAASSTSPARSPARRSSTRRCATSAASSTPHGVDVRLNTRVTRRALQTGGFDEVVRRHRRHPAHPRRSRASTIPSVRQLPRRAARRQRRSATASRSSAPAASASTSPSS